MKVKILLLVLVIACALTMFGCKRNPDPPPPPLPTDLIPIPDYINSPDKIEYWHRQIKSRWVSDKDTTGYEDYRFSPAEFLMPVIPDVNKPGNIIEKIPYQSDCDDFAIINPYIAYVKFGFKPTIIYILNLGNIHVAHAISYAIDGNKCHVWDNQYYRGFWPDINSFLEEIYPNWIIYFTAQADDYIRNLIKDGHIDYYSPPTTSRRSKKSEPNVCPVDGDCE